MGSCSPASQESTVVGGKMDRLAGAQKILLTEELCRTEGAGPTVDIRVKRLTQLA